MADLNFLDIGILTIFFVSVLISVYRGFLRETLTIVTWIIASVIAYMYGKQAAAVFTFAETESTRTLLGMSSVFVLVVFVGFIIKFAVCKAFNIGGPSGLDRVLGAIFGFIRATAIIVLVMLVEPESITQQPWYKQSILIPKFNNIQAMVNTTAPKGWKDNMKQDVDKFFGGSSEPANAAAAGLSGGTGGAAGAAGTNKVEPMFPPAITNTTEPTTVPPATQTKDSHSTETKPTH